MYVPAEAFDFIPMLQDASSIIKVSNMNKMAGNYEIILEMKVSAGQDVSGCIAHVTVSFKF